MEPDRVIESSFNDLKFQLVEHLRRLVGHQLHWDYDKWAIVLLCIGSIVWEIKRKRWFKHISFFFQYPQQMKWNTIKILGWSYIDCKISEVSGLMKSKGNVIYWRCKTVPVSIYVTTTRFIEFLFSYWQSKV